MENTFVSVVIPLYKGKKYMNTLISMFEKNKEELRGNGSNTKLELIFVNDFPNEKINEIDYIDRKIKCVVINNPVNKGIHHSRIIGLKRAKGNYILFFDQDDSLMNHYLYNQLQYIGDKDAVLCNGIFRNNKRIYEDFNVQKKVVQKSYYIRQKKVIISPGQVLLRRDAIPLEWENIILNENGSDDVLLWVLMLFKEKQFAVNPNVLYVHNENENQNTSLDFNNMLKSVTELKQVVCESGFMQQDDIDIFTKALENRQEKYRSYNEILKKWDTIIIKIVKMKEENPQLSIAIYGWGILGKKLYNDLKKNNIEIEFAIDKEADSYNEGNLNVYSTNEDFPDVDLVIVTAVFAYKEIQSQLQKENVKSIVSLAKII